MLASSSSVYGATETMPKHEGMVPAPISPYAVSKLAAEQYARAFWSVYELETVSLRYFNVFGPRQDPNSQYSGVVPRFMRLALEGEEPVVFGDGSQSRDFTYVANVVDATLSAAVADRRRGEHLQHRLRSPEDRPRPHRRHLPGRRAQHQPAVRATADGRRQALVRRHRRRAQDPGLRAQGGVRHRRRL